MYTADMIFFNPVVTNLFIVLKRKYVHFKPFLWFQNPPSSIFDEVNLYIEKKKLKFIMCAAAWLTGKRPTHPDGIGAQGIATIVADPQFPNCEFFTPGRCYPVCLRHSTLKSIDDAGLNFLSASIRFADSNEESSLDILMSTGRSAIFWDVQGIYDALEATRSGDLKGYYLKRPD